MISSLYKQYREIKKQNLKDYLGGYSYQQQTRTVTILWPNEFAQNLDAGEVLNQTSNFKSSFDWANDFQKGIFFLLWTHKLTRFSKWQKSLDFIHKQILETDLKIVQKLSMQYLTLWDLWSNLTFVKLDWIWVTDYCFLSLMQTNSTEINWFWVDAQDLRLKFTHSWTVSRFEYEFDFFSNECPNKWWIWL